jgi:hypothetical protein
MSRKLINEPTNRTEVVTQLRGIGRYGNRRLTVVFRRERHETISGHVTALPTLTTHLYKYFNIIILSRVSKTGSSISVFCVLLWSYPCYITSPNISSYLIYFSRILSTFLSFLACILLKPIESWGLG